MGQKRELEMTTATITIAQQIRDLATAAFGTRAEMTDYLAAHGYRHGGEVDRETEKRVFGDWALDVAARLNSGDILTPDENGVLQLTHRMWWNQVTGDYLLLRREDQDAYANLFYQQ